MGRLIDADALLSEMEKYSDPTAREKNEYLFGMQQRLETCIELVEDAPTVDAVEVVRCRDCSNYNAGYECLIDGYGVERDPDWYCGDGKRKDGDNEQTD